MSLNIKEILDPQPWQQFITDINPNTFLQTWAWGQVQKNTDEDIHYLGFFEQEQLVGVALLIVVKAKRGWFYLCPHGPVFATDEATIASLPLLRAYAKQHASSDRAVALKIAPLIVNTSSNQADFAKLGFRPAPLHIHTELTWVVDISADAETLLKNMRKTTRHMIRKAEQAGVTVDILRDEAALDRFMPLYTRTTHRHGFVPFSRDFLTKELQAFLVNNQAFVAIAHQNNQDIAAAILVQSGTTVFYHHGASLPSQTGAAQLLQWSTMQEAKRRGATKYNLWGIAPEGQPNHPFAGITVFKKGFGGYAIDYMHAQDLPLSWKYWKMWLIDTYRKYRRGF